MAETGNQRDLTKGEKTKYRLARAMKECMQTTPVENITVKQITEKCELTRQTFYRNFLDKYDLINWYFDKLLTNLLNIWDVERRSMMLWSRSLLIFRKSRHFLRQRFVMTNRIPSDSMISN